MRMTQMCLAGSPAPPRPLTTAAFWQRLTVGLADGWVAVARATGGGPDYFWAGDASPGAFLDGLERLDLYTRRPMAALIAVYSCPEAVVTAWQCHVDGLRCTGTCPPRYSIEPYPLVAVTDRGRVPDRSAASRSAEGIPS